LKRITQQLFVDEIWLDAAGQLGGYAAAIAALQHLNPLQLNTPVTFLIGENGSGKSTILLAIADAFGMNMTGGGRNFRSEESQETPRALPPKVRLVRSPRRPTDDFFHRADTFFNLAAEVERLGVSGYGDRILREQSHGESVLALLTHRFRGDGFYLLDEPEAALSPARQLAALVRIHDLVALGSQFIIATHSPILMALPGATILQLDQTGIRKVALEDTDHFTITRDFLNDRTGYLRHLLNPG
jgi:predicted ATPase